MRTNVRRYDWSTRPRHTLSPDCNTSAQHPSCLFRNRHISVTETGGSTFSTEAFLPKSEDRVGESSKSLCRDIKKDMTSGVDIILQAAHLLDGPYAARGEENRSHMAGSADMRTIFFLFILPNISPSVYNAKIQET